MLIILIKLFTQTRHEDQVHPGAGVTQILDNTNKGRKDDFIFNYHKSKLAFGLVLMEFNDCIKEGDGQRLHDLYKVVLLLFKANGKHKYSYVILLHLLKLAGLLSEYDGHILKWNRFFNKHGGKGKNIPLDLRMEQLNKIVKTMWRSLGANINEKSASRVAESVELTELILDAIDGDCDLHNNIGYRTNGKPEIAVNEIISDLIIKKVFEYTPGRAGHHSFPNFPSNLLSRINFKELHDWMHSHISTWESIFEANRDK